MDPTMLEEFTARVALLAERFVAEREKPAEAVVLSPAEQQAALGMLRDRNLLDRMPADLEKLGYVGEDTNKLVAFVASISRKLAEPLSILVVSRSGAGKSDSVRG